MRKLKSARPILKKREADVLRFVKWHIKSCGYPPTRIEIGDALGFSGPTAQYHLEALQEHKLLTLRTQWRGIFLRAA
jgi:SOS-response transcriptional repressor LexA